MTRKTEPAEHDVPDLSLHTLLPHRGPMLLLDEVVEVGADHAESMVVVNDNSSFFETGRGVPAWIGMEYMGQTAALIAGYQLQQGELEPHVGLFLGTRKYETSIPWFSPGSRLTIRCSQKAVSPGTMATFTCEIRCEGLIAEAVLNVYRQPIRN